MKKRLGETTGNDGGFGICLSPFFIVWERTFKKVKLRVARHMKKRLGETAGNEVGFGICLAALFYSGSLGAFKISVYAFIVFKAVLCHEKFLLLISPKS